MVQGVNTHGTQAVRPGNSSSAATGGGASHAPQSSGQGRGWKTTMLFSALVGAKLAFAQSADTTLPMTHGNADTLGASRRDDGSLVYAGHALPAGSPNFYKKNTHPYIDGNADVDLTGVVHPDYLQQDTRKVGKDIMLHRGLINVYEEVLENTKEALHSAYDSGVRSIEADIQVTRDGVPILFHDQSLGRMTDDPHNSLVGRTDWADIKDRPLVLRNPVDGNFIETKAKIPSLEETLKDVKATMPGMSMVLDCKDQTSEAVVDLLSRNKDLRDFSAIKPYAQYYVGGFDQMLSNLYEKHGIDPQSPHDEGKRKEMLASLKEMKLVPVFSQNVLNDKGFRSMFAEQKKEHYAPEELAGMALKWLQSWGENMDVKIIEAHSMGPDTVEGKAMDLLNGWLAKESSGLSKAAMSGSYRYEDFSVPTKEGGHEYFTWDNTGGLVDRTKDTIAAQRETAGALRHEADSILTDQLPEEAFAIRHDVTLPRGNTGVELDVAPGTHVDVARNKELAALRKQQALGDLTKFDQERVALVRAGRPRDSADIGNAGHAGKDDGYEWSKVAGATVLGAVAVGSAALIAKRYRVPLSSFHPGRSLSRLSQAGLLAVGGMIIARQQQSDPEAGIPLVDRTRNA